MRWTRPELKLFRARLFLIGKQIDAFDKHWYVHDMFISLFPRFWFSSCYSFPVLLLFFPRLVLNTCLLFPTVFLTADKTTDPASCFIFGGRTTALPYCGSQTGPDFAVSSFLAGRSGKIGNHQMSCFAVSHVTGLKYRWGDGTLGLALIFWKKGDASWYPFLYNLVMNHANWLILNA